MSKENCFKLLIVEDTPETQTTLQQIFETQEDIEISIAKDGVAASEMINKGYLPNVVILDLNMPRMNGADFLRTIGENLKLKGTKIFPFSSTVSEETNQAFESAKPMVDQYIEARNISQKAGNLVITDIIPKYKGQEGVNIIHPKLVIVVAQELLRKGFELSPSFQQLLYISQKQVVHLAIKK